LIAAGAVRWTEATSSTLRTSRSFARPVRRRQYAVAVTVEPVKKQVRRIGEFGAKLLARYLPVVILVGGAQAFKRRTLRYGAA